MFSIDVLTGLTRTAGSGGREPFLRAIQEPSRLPAGVVEFAVGLAAVAALVFVLVRGGLTGRRGLLAALIVGALGSSLAFALGQLQSGLDLGQTVLLAVGAGVVAGILTRGGRPALALLAGYGAVWAVFLAWYATFVGFHGLDVLGFYLLAALLVAAAIGFAAGWVVSLLASALVRRLRSQA